MGSVLVRKFVVSGTVAMKVDVGVIDVDVSMVCVVIVLVVSVVFVVVAVCIGVMLLGLIAFSDGTLLASFCGRNCPSTLRLCRVGSAVGFGLVCCASDGTLLASLCGRNCPSTSMYCGVTVVDVLYGVLVMGLLGCSL